MKLFALIVLLLSVVTFQGFFISGTPLRHWLLWVPLGMALLAALLFCAT
jgi:hypothetical protein